VVLDQAFKNAYPAPVARPKEFDPDAAAGEAMEAFWERGYAATSVNDLLEEMGLNRGSLYGTFGDKKQLFLAALDKYQDQNASMFWQVLEQPGSARRAVESLLNLASDKCMGTDAKKGCLAAKAAMELAPHDKDIAAWLKRFHRRHVDLLTRTIARGQADGEFSPRLDARATARFLLNGLAGLSLLGTMRPDRAEVHDVVKMMLKVLD
jgi:TetR/AcrR family transcriptional repressor of nem operon